jgi:hypothetical protein
MKRLWIAVLVGTFTLTAVLAGSGGARPGLPELGMAGKRTVSVDVAGFDKQHGPHSDIECTKVTAATPSQIMDCDDPLPNNEPDVEVHPTNPNLLVASSNDYGSCCDEFYTSTNGGTSWVNGNISIEKPQKTGSDPATAFDPKHGTIIHSSLSYSLLHAAGTQACDGDLVVSVSKDGLTWDKPVVVDDGDGCDLSKVQTFNDKPWIVTDTAPTSAFYGRSYLTWSKFLSRTGAYVSSEIWESHSDDGGHSWSTPKPISGFGGALCTDQTDGPAGVCDENQWSVPTVDANGTLYVAFENSQNTSLWDGKAGEFDDQYLLVRSTNGGQTFSAPSFVVGLEDGASDYPLNVNDRQTLTGYQVRVTSAGNIVADPRVGNAGKLYLAFSDNRNGTPASGSTPAVTNSDVFVVSSTNGGATWSPPTQVDTGAGDQWFPWVDVDPTTGVPGVLYNDRGASNGATYGASLKEGGAKTVLNARPSDPTNSVFFQAGVAGCMKCATFHGDYIRVAYDSTGVAHALWTDMSVDNAVAAFGTGKAQFIAYAKH